MGNIADFINDQMQDAFPEWNPFGTVKQHGKQNIVCNICHKKHLSWKHIKGVWVLIDKNGNPHRCNINADKLARKFDHGR